MTGRRPRAAPLAFSAERRRIVAVDGEGNDIDGRHAYTMMCAADDAGWSAHVMHDGTRRERDERCPGCTRAGGPRCEHRPANYGLPTARCLDFLLSLPRSSADLLVAFSFNYDVTKIIADLPLANLDELARLGVTRWGDYLLNHVPRKWLTVSVPKYGTMRLPTGGRRYVRQAQVWDAFGYFQMRFVDALGKSRHLFDDHELAMLATVEDMKAKRSQFHLETVDDILAYCYSEVRMLAKMQREVEVAAEQLPGGGVRPRQHHGAAAIAVQWMRDRSIPEHRGDAGIPADAIMGAYFGGRFETSHIGRIGDTHAYDINSAYPHTMRRLPCLAHATSRWVTDVEPGKWAVYDTGSRTSGPWAPFPCRIDKGTAQAVNLPIERLPERFRSSPYWQRVEGRQVVFAHGGRRWLWQDEVEVARRHFGADAIPVFGGYVIDEGCDTAGCELPRPFAEFEGLYARRGEVGPGLNKVIKLLLASGYGMCAKSIGYRPRAGVTSTRLEQVRADAYARGDDPDDAIVELVEAPDTQCLAWAGMITSGCRAMVLDAILRSGTVVSVATDGIISTAPIPELEPPECRTCGADHEAKVLGAWEHTRYRNLVLFRDGIYSYDQWDPAGERWSPGIKSRGFSPRDITAAMLAEAWDDNLWQVDPLPEARMFLGLRTSLARTDPLDALGQWVPNTRSVSFQPHKRRFPTEWWDRGRPAVLPCDPFTIPDDAVSQRYEPKQSARDVAEAMGWFGSEATGDDDYYEPSPEAPELLALDRLAIGA